MCRRVREGRGAIRWADLAVLKRPLTAAMRVSRSADKLFECHIRLEAAAKATFSKVIPLRRDATLERMSRHVAFCA